MRQLMVVGIETVDRNCRRHQASSTEHTVRWYCRRNHTRLTQPNSLLATVIINRRPHHIPDPTMGTWNIEHVTD